MKELNEKRAKELNDLVGKKMTYEDQPHILTGWRPATPFQVLNTDTYQVTEIPAVFMTFDRISDGKIFTEKIAVGE